MPARPQFTPQEKLRQISRRPSTRFVIVEGVDDVPAYSALFCSVVSPDVESQWEIIQVEGKRNVIGFLNQYSGSNVRFIVDKDFDVTVLSDDRLIILSRYSLENYFVCEDILSHCLSVPLRMDPRDIRSELNMDEFLRRVSSQAEQMLKACFYYHRVISPTLVGDKPSWTDDSIYIRTNGDLWVLCEHSIDSIIRKLIPDTVLPEQIEQYFQQNYDYDGNVAYAIPGKMLKEPLRRFVRRFYRGKKSKGGTQFNTLDGFTGVVIGNLSVSRSLRLTMQPIINFLNNVA